jgi:predicted ester cyclase
MHGIPLTGEKIDIRAMYHIKDGQLAEGWFVEDNADTLGQLRL